MNSNLLAQLEPLSKFYKPGAKVGGANATYSNLLTPIIANAIIVLGVLSLFAFLSAGFLYISSSGDPKRIEKAQKTLLYAIIGAVLAGGSFIVTNIIGVLTGFKFFG